MYVKSIEYLPSINSTDAQWVSWYEILRSDVGKKNANNLFLKAWEQRKNEGMLGSKANTSYLRNFLSEKGIELSPDGILAYPIAAIDSLEGFAEGVFGFGKTTFIIVLSITIVILAVFMFNIARNPKMIVDGLNAYRGGGVR